MVLLRWLKINQSAMANHRRNMNEVKQILRLHYERKTSIKQISRELAMSKNTVKEYLRKFQASNLELTAVLSMDPAELSTLLLPEHSSATSRHAQFLERAPEYLNQLSTHKHLTRQVLWEEEHTNGHTAYRYSQFCYHLQQYEQSQKTRSVLQFSPGDKLQIDFAGDKLYYTDRDSGKLTPCEILVLTMAYSHKTLAIALPSQKVEDLIPGIVKGLQWLGAVPRSLVCDNMKSAVTKSDRYEPVINEALLDMANYYAMSVLPTRVRKPRDKSRVEGAVNHLYQQVYGRMRNQSHYSINEVNEALLGHCNEFNQRIMKGYGMSRDELYTSDELPQMPPLPSDPYQLVKRYNLLVSNNSHIYISSKKQYYSVPYRLIGQRVIAVANSHTMQIYHKGECVATHAITGLRYTTEATHMPSHHNAHNQAMNPQWLMQKSAQVGESVQAVIAHVLQRNRHPEQNYKTCQGILALEKKVGAKRLNSCCEYALLVGLVSYNSIKRWSENPHFDHQAPMPQSGLPTHENTRGSQNYR